MAFLGATSTGHFICEDTLAQLGRSTGIDGHMGRLLGESRIAQFSIQLQNTLNLNCRVLLQALQSLSLQVRAPEKVPCPIQLNPQTELCSLTSI